ncbi:MAG: HPF/RaiA family ribosome-associated protein, partial [Variovorax sp.]
MQIQVNASNGIENKETLERWADGEIKSSLARFV